MNSAARLDQDRQIRARIGISPRRESCLEEIFRIR
jgi:hypothetical protein